ncbi:MAG: MBL fold metallo-hydrolase [Pseudomonadota bacterium]|nr:MAG: MBL fold metallo-hydrolase [Pseudomonadota bacterium]
MDNRVGVCVAAVAALGLCLATGAALADNKHKEKEKLAVDKVKGPLSVLVLGSGGPVAAASGRASAAYLIFCDGEPCVLMDAGGGAYQRLAASGANVRNLDIVLLSHLHIDHTGDLSSIIKTIYFHARGFNLANKAFPPGRTAPIRIFGPAANGAEFPPVLEADPGVAQYPSSSEYVHGHYDLNTGLERYLNIFSRAISGGIFDYKPMDVSPDWTAYNPETLIDEDGLVITAVGVNHGPVPALAFRIEYKGHTIVYSGDTSSRSTTLDGAPLPNGGNMVSISRGADLLIYDTAITDDLPNGPNDAVFFGLHTTPSRIGEVATAAGVKHLVLSHITPITEPRLKEVKKRVRAQGYRRKLSAAEDLNVYNLKHHD